MARRVCAERADTVTQILGAIRDGDLDRASLHAHGMKAILGTLGAHALARACAVLDRTLQAGEPDAAALGKVARDFPVLIGAMGAACMPRHDAA